MAKEYINDLLPNISRMQEQIAGQISSGAYPCVVMDMKWPLLYVKGIDEVLDISPLYFLTEDAECEGFDAIMTFPAPDPLVLVRFVPVKDDAEIEINDDIFQCDIEDGVIAIAQAILEAAIDAIQNYAGRDLAIHTYLFRSMIGETNALLQSEYDGDVPMEVVREAYKQLGLVLSKGYAKSYKCAGEVVASEFEAEVEEYLDDHDSHDVSQRDDNHGATD